MPMHPSPTADTSRPCFPSFRFVNMSPWMLAHLLPVQLAASFPAFRPQALYLLLQAGVQSFTEAKG